MSDNFFFQIIHVPNHKKLFFFYFQTSMYIHVHMYCTCKGKIFVSLWKLDHASYLYCTGIFKCNIQNSGLNNYQNADKILMILHSLPKVAFPIYPGKKARHVFLNVLIHVLLKKYQMKSSVQTQLFLKVFFIILCIINYMHFDFFFRSMNL